MRTLGFACFLMSLFLANNLIAQNADQKLNHDWEILDSDPNKLPKWMLGLDLGYWSQFRNLHQKDIPDLRIYGHYIFNKNYKLDLKLSLITDPELNGFNRFNEFHLTTYRTLFSGQTRSKRKLRVGSEERMANQPRSDFAKVEYKMLRALELNFGLSHFQIKNWDQLDVYFINFYTRNNLRDANYSNIKLGLSFFSNYYIKHRVNKQINKRNMNYRIYAYVSYAFHTTVNNLAGEKVEIAGIQPEPNLSGIANLEVKPFGWRIGGERNWSNLNSTIVPSLSLEFGSLPYLRVQRDFSRYNTWSPCFMIGLGFRYGKLPD